MCGFWAYNDLINKLFNRNVDYFWSGFSRQNLSFIQMGIRLMKANQGAPTYSNFLSEYIMLRSQCMDYFEQLSKSPGIQKSKKI